ncbi:MAG TPA: peroxiredoxin [Candidatus Azoamicus sp. OHIO1]
MLIGKPAVDFTLPAVLADGNIVNDYNLYKNIDGKYCLLFFYPMDFTFVCPSELIAINNRIKEFKKRNVEVIAVSIDSQYVHKAWRSVPLENGGIGNDISYALISDIKHQIIDAYGIKDCKSGISFRGTFIIDTNKIVRICHVHDFQIGRNIDEYIRLIDALIFNSKYGNVCQAGWKNGSNGIVPTVDGISSYLKLHHKDI